MPTHDTGGKAQSGKVRRDSGYYEDAPPPEADPEATERAKKVSEETEDLIDEMDKVLEENPAEFMKGYVQKGGE